MPRDDREATRLYQLAADQGLAEAQTALAKRRGIFSRLFGDGAKTADDRPHQLEEQERQREAAAEEERERRWREAQEREREAAREQQRRWQEERDREREAAERARQRQEDDRQRDAAFGNVSAAQALEILGLAEGANEEQVHAAYHRLIKRVHPDVGGSSYFAKQLNAARDALLKQRQG